MKSTTREQDRDTYHDDNPDKQYHAHDHMSDRHDRLTEPVRLHGGRFRQLELRTANRAALVRANFNEENVLPAIWTKSNGSAHNFLGAGPTLT